jgi:N-methylhydantoinase A/oxoprolinase/acetone carboxylase beta subunit
MPAHETIRIGVDTGGTFTDLLCLDLRGLRVHKLRSVPSDPSSAILAGIRALLNIEPGDTALEVTHGSTVATNAVLERKGARLALITTAGFEDVLRIGRQTRPELYNFMVRRAEPLVAPELTFGLHERIAADGSILHPLDPAELNALIANLREKQIDSVAVCFLHSYAFPQHEQVAAAALRAAGFRVSTSHEILPEYREYERWATTAVNAYVAPLMARYLERLQQNLGAASLRIMQSNGGSISAARAATEAVQTILSGPAAGVIGAQALGALSGHTRLITFDMGGTSTDVSLVDQVIATTSESLVGDLPVRLPVLDIHTVGAGGGSIAWIDAAGGLRVGPRSAGADPGPVCFGTGTELTVTDANLLLGRLDSSYFLGGRLTLDLTRTQSIAAAFAQRFNLTVPALAEGILRIANANMERAVRVVSVQRGFDPRDFALLAFGGAGGLHACDLAAALDIATVLIPEHSGVLSALGMLLADVAKDYSASVLRPGIKLTVEDLQSKLTTLTAQAHRDLAAEGFSPEQITLTAALAMRYQGQAFEIDVPLTAHTLTEESLAALDLDFHQRHAKLYGYSNPHRATEAVQLRLRASGRTTKPQLRVPQVSILRPGLEAPQSPTALPTPDATRETVFAGESLATSIFHRNRLSSGMGGIGPTIIVTGESTNVIPPHWSWHIDSAGTLVASQKVGTA